MRTRGRYIYPNLVTLFGYIDDRDVPRSRYQHLHSDGGGGSKGPDTYPDVLFEYRNDGNRYKVATEAGRGRGGGGETIESYERNPDYRYQIINGRDVPLRESMVTANYPMEICFDSEVGHTAYNGKPSSPSPHLALIILA